ncbi:FliM/FliN family flagellar motor switch protein [Nereida sp. MMG025]|uniref:FliM/FliN family flagellar motor switch protein n=1 Tax=Nereida sp. MMG025 TaxID=2909981 RepID=UPI001F377C4B|nr:FliM/FliN family flagellar motor switch protein [Nereida sp. MMG025]MCF6444663.1 FliM/FliN family flagellar motor switch protein [Nereida sp. MMG025]
MADETQPNPFSDLPVEITVSVGHARPKIKDLMSIRPDDVLPLDCGIADPVELFVGGRLIGRGELVELEGEDGSGLAVKLTEIPDVPRL